MFIDTPQNVVALSSKTDGITSDGGSPWMSDFDYSRFRSGECQSVASYQIARFQRK